MQAWLITGSVGLAAAFVFIAARRRSSQRQTFTTQYGSDGATPGTTTGTTPGTTTGTTPGTTTSEWEFV